MSAVIRTRGLRRSFDTRKGFLFQEKVHTDALKGVDLDIPPGEIFGLLGPNGAGKTTLVKVLSTLLLPTSGSAEVLGLDVVRQTRKLRSRIGLVLGGERGLYNRVSARENLRYFADLYGLPPHERESRIDELLEKVGLADAKDRRVEEFSRGMKQKLHLARGLLHQPELLFLDEPTIGLDPKSSREIRKLVREQVSSGVSVFLTTHYMPEAEELCARIAVLSQGRIVAQDTPRGLGRLIGGERTLEFEALGLDDAELQGLKRLPGVSRVLTEDFGPRLRVTLRARTDELTTQRVAQALPQHPGVEVRERRTTVEDAYLDLVEEAAS